MITAILPIQIKDNSFWCSDTGKAALNDFFAKIIGIEEISQSIILSNDKAVAHLGKEYGMSTLPLSDQCRQIESFSIDRVRLFIQGSLNREQVNNNFLFMIDHRNASLSMEMMKKAITNHSEKKGMCLISVVKLDDHACQYKTFYKFLDCKVLPFESPPIGVLNPVTFSIENNEVVSLIVTTKENKCLFGFHRQAEPMDAIEDDLICHIIPYSSDGPHYDRSVEFIVSDQSYDQEIISDTGWLKGVICILTKISRNGSYDMTELFAPKKGGWRIDDTTHDILNGKSGERIQGRQQMPSTLSFDGSLCLAEVNFFWTDDDHWEYLPMDIGESIIVNDWIDYYASIAMRTGRDAL